MSVYEEDIKLLKHEIHLREVAITELRRKLELAQKQKDKIQLTVEKYKNSSKSLSKLIDYHIVDKCKTGLGYNDVPPTYIGHFMSPKPDLSFSGLEEFVNDPIVSKPTVKKPVVETSEAKASADMPKAVRKNNGAPLIKDWVSDTEEEDVPQAKIQKEKLQIQVSDGLGPQKRLIFLPYVQGNPQQDLEEKGVIDSECSRHMTRNMSYLTDFEEINGGYVAFGGNPKGGKITGRGTKACDDAGKMETVPGKDYILLPLWPVDPLLSQSSKSSFDDGFKPLGDYEKKITKEPGKEGGDSSKDSECNDQEKDDNVNSTNNVNAASINEVNAVGPSNQKNDKEFGKEKWNKKDEKGIVIKNKARLVTQGYTQEEGIDYEEVFSSVARIKAISLFLAYASFKDFMVYQIDVKSDFLYGKIEEEVYVCQPPGFKDLEFPDRVYKVEKALYGLHQAPKALLDNGFQRGKIDKTLFIRRDKEFEKMMHKKFQMRSMGELTFFLGLQVKQKEDGIFISQDKYVIEILKKFGFSDVKTASTPMETQKPLLKDEDSEKVDCVPMQDTKLTQKCHIFML
ncbi:retrovirus-related pol polyprotein from transposon TNT 1-94 [Tanacetum coccineum]